MSDLCPTPYSTESEAPTAHRKLLIGTELGDIHLVRKEEIRLAMANGGSCIYLMKLDDGSSSLLLLRVLLKCQLV